MHRRLLSLAVLALATAPALLAQAPEPKGGDRPRRERREAAPVELKNFTFREEKFHSEAINRDHPFGIYLPTGYDDAANKDKKWPVVIWLHGMWEDHLRFHQRGGAPVLDQCVGDGKLPPCIFVTANGGRTSMYLNRKDERWEDQITKDLLEHLSKNFRASDIARDWFGDTFVDHFAATRDWEYRQWQDAVTDWELKRYFEII